MLTEEQKEEAHKIIIARNDISSPFINFALSDIEEREVKQEYLQYICEIETLITLKALFIIYIYNGDGDLINEKVTEMVTEALKYANKDFEAFNNTKDNIDQLREAIENLFDVKEKEDEC